LDDLARVAGGALGALSGVRGEVEARLKEQFRRILGEMETVSREEFDVVREVAANARAAQEKLEARVATLEAALAGKPAKAAKAKARGKSAG
ncbi:MAG: accessory factor UbiK family protein, partial [Alphaproteobacteria bacterium]